MELAVGLVGQRFLGKALERMNAVGSEGWEAVGFVAYTRGNVTVLFKRRLAETPGR